MNRNLHCEELQSYRFYSEFYMEIVTNFLFLQDLSEISNGLLAQSLQQGIDFGKEHVTTCWLCSQKGFICEVCNKPKTIFPFDVENVYRVSFQKIPYHILYELSFQCNYCNAVYHKQCLTKHKPCPKCKRKKDREDSSLLSIE